MKIERLYIPTDFKRYLKTRNQELLTEEAIDFDPNHGRNSKDNNAPQEEERHGSPHESAAETGTVPKRTDKLVDIVA